MIQIYQTDQFVGYIFLVYSKAHNPYPKKIKGVII